VFACLLWLLVHSGPQVSVTHILGAPEGRKTLKNKSFSETPRTKKKKKLWVSGHATDSYWSPGFKKYQRNGFFCGPFTDIENGRMTKKKKKKGSGV
jgi:hypothetical protein